MTGRNKLPRWVRRVFTDPNARVPGTAPTRATRPPAVNPAALRGVLSLVCSLAWFAGSTGCSRPPAPDPDLVARIGDREIRVAEFEDWMRHRAVGANQRAKEALLEELFDHYAAVQEAVDRGLDRDPAIRRAWENLLVSRLREQQLEPRLTNAVPTPSQVAVQYSNRIAAFNEPELRRGAMLFASLPPEAPEDRRMAVRERLARARQLALGASAAEPGTRGFGALAVEFSEDPVTRYKGGDLGWLAASRSDNRFDPAVLEVLFALRQTNDVSGVIETPRGFYVVKWLDVRPARVKSLESVRAMLEHELLIENRRQAEADWRLEVREGRRIEVFPEVLNRITAPAGRGVAGPPDPPAVP